MPVTLLSIDFVTLINGHRDSDNTLAPRPSSLVFNKMADDAGWRSALQTQSSPLTCARGCDVSPPRVCQDLAIPNHSHANLVGAAFKTQYRWHARSWEKTPAGLLATTAVVGSSPVRAESRCRGAEAEDQPLLLGGRAHPPRNQTPVRQRQPASVVKVTLQGPFKDQSS